MMPVLVGLCSFSCSTDSEQPTQAVVIVIDTLRQDALGCYGYEGDPTPNIDALAAEGTRFDQAISSSGWTLPSVASILTASWPSMHKALGKNTRLTPITSDLPTGPELLQKQGVATAAVANAAFLSPMLGLQRGFDDFDHEPAFNDRIRRADASVDLALRMIDERKEGEFFVLLHLFDPHLDYDAPDGYAEAFVGTRNDPARPVSMTDCRALQQAKGRMAPTPKDVDYIKGQYQAEVAFVDRSLGRLFDGMRQMGVYDDCMIVLTADHGEEFWEHGGLEHGHSLYDELVRVPLIVRGAAKDQEPASVVASQVRTLDVLPTVLHEFGASFPAGTAGQSLMPLILGTDGTDRDAWLEGTLYGNDRRALRGNRYKYILSEQKEGPALEELFDWRLDPGESTNMLATKPDVAQQMRAAFTSFRTQLESDAAQISAPDAEQINPETAREFERSLQSLGYTGRDDDDEDE
ncbi:MAG: arylsulfatase A-like enzyme [Planctomycetota bacterium]|jgi:arylsulfatase A-like enzyme